MNMDTQALEVQLLEAVLFDEKNGELMPPEDRAEGLDTVRKKILAFGEVLDNMDEMSLHMRAVVCQTFVRVTETYLGILEKHDEFVAAGR